ncbi:hypothetical protein BC628DRAFT_1327265 [Trametes gibbosa]|nr:hypothetical protein BC628DRAFT_1327265 [Trametes gibbosa]
MPFPFSTEPAISVPAASLSMSTHKALQVEEILSTIFRHLSPYAWNRQVALAAPEELGLAMGKDLARLGLDCKPCTENLRTLARAARVSRSFTAPALKVLWRTLPDLRPLLHVLEVMGFSYEDLELGIPIHTFPASIKPPNRVQEWERYRWYASSVVGIRAAVDYDALEQWSDKGGPPLLPDIQSAQFRFDPRCVHRMLRLLTPSLYDLTLEFDSPNNRSHNGPRMSSVDILATAAARAPFVEVLNLTFGSYPKNLSSLLPRFSRLRVLIVTGWLTPSLHAAIEALEHLETLYVKLYWSRADGDLQDLHIRQYRSVKTIVVLTLSEAMIRALSSAEFPSLEHIRLEVWPHSSDATEVLTRAMESMREHSPRLWSFCLTTRSAAAHGDRPPPRLVSVIEPLVNKPTLRNISITLEDNYSFALTREDILSFPNAWPNLSTLCLAHAPLHTSDPAPSIYVFFDFIAACPRIETLVLCARFSCTSRAQWQDVSIPPHPTLRALFLGLDPETGSYNPDRTWRVLAAALIRCVPHLDLKQELVRPEVVGVRAVETWQGVVRHMRDLRASTVQVPGSPDW